MRRHSWIPAALLAALFVTLGAGRALRGGSGQAAQAPAFEVDPLWPRPMPNHWLLGSAVGVAVDARDHVFVVHLTNSFNARTEIGAASDPPTGECCRPAPAVLEFDPDGNLVRQWGGPGNGYAWPSANHGIAIDPQGNIWIGGSAGTDTHMLKFSADGRFLQQIGRVAPPPPPAPSQGSAAGDTAGGGRGGRGGGRGAAAQPPPVVPPDSRSTAQFGGAASVSFDASTREAFVADGYRNRRIAVVDMTTGAITRFFGAYGAAPDDAPTPPYNPDSPAPRVIVDGRPVGPQFGTPVTCAELSRDGMLYVCDRSNNRIQVFQKNGTFVKEATIAPRTRGQGAVWDIAFSRDPEQRYLYVADGSNMKVHIVDRQSLNVLTSFGDGGRQPGQFLAVHSVATDSRGNLYTTETYEGKRVQKFLFKGIAPVTRQNSGVLWPTRR